MEADIERIVRDFECGQLSRRQLIVHLTGLVGAVVAASRVSAAADGSASTFQATDINHVALRVTDVARSRAFYEKHLGLTLMSDRGSSSVFLRCGKDFLALFRGNEPRMDHYCYTIKDYDPAAAVERLKGVGLEPERRGNRVYFKDPDGLEVQVSALNA